MTQGVSDDSICDGVANITRAYYDGSHQFCSDWKYGGSDTFDNDKTICPGDSGENFIPCQLLVFSW